MRPHPLNASQQTAVDALAATGRITAVPVDLPRAEMFLRQANEAIADLANLTRPQNQYSLAYDACHDVGEALLAAYGYRTVNGPGQHATVGAFLRAVFDRPPGQQAARRFDKLRRSRNQQRYDAQPVGAADAQIATQAAADLLTAARAQGLEAR